MTPIETAWTAGLFEGEGCISLNRVGSGLGGCLVIRMTDPDVLERFMTATGCGRIRGPLATAAPHHKPSYEWRAGRWSDVEQLLQAWLPYLGERRRAKAHELLAQPRTYASPQGSGFCIRGHALEGTEADVRVSRDKRGHLSRQCRRCVRDKQRALRLHRKECAA